MAKLRFLARLRAWFWHYRYSKRQLHPTAANAWLRAKWATRYAFGRWEES